MNAAQPEEAYEILDVETEVVENPLSPSEEAIPDEEDYTEELEIVESIAQSAVEESAEKLQADEAASFTSIDTAAAFLREQMKERQQICTFHLQMTDTRLAEDSYRQGLLKDVFTKALVHTGNGTEGDYLAWHYENWTGSVAGIYYKSTGIYDLILTYHISYYTTLDQERQLSTDLYKIEQELHLDGRADSEKIQVIYDYICNHVTYDYAHLYDNGYLLKQTAYAAVENNTAVCQGYALLFYRMALDCGIDNRIVSGYANGNEKHGWNIVKVNGAYYYIDTTWDSGKTEYSYYLKGSDTFLKTHTLAGTPDILADTSALLVTKYNIPNTDYEEQSDSDIGGEDAPVYGTGIYEVDGQRIYFVNGQRQNITDVVFIDGIWYNLVDGVVTANTVAKNSNGWWYIDEYGMVDFGYSGFAKNIYGWWYCENGKVTFQKNDVIKGSVEGTEGWWLVRGSKWTRQTTVAKNVNGWWYIRNGKVDFTANTVAKNEYGWWYIRNGKVNFTANTVAKNEYGWWYIRNGKVDFAANTVAKNEYGWWCIQNGKVNFAFNGIASNAYGQWYLQGGKVNFNYSGTAIYRGRRYRVSGGKVM